MARKSKVEQFTHEGAIAGVITPKKQLRRVVMSTMLWEPNAYESGQEIADNIAKTVKAVPPAFALKVAVEARDVMHLRHVPLWVAANMATFSPSNLKNHPKGTYHDDWNNSVVVSSFIEDAVYYTVQRPDEIGEFINLYHIVNGKRAPLPASVKKGLARAFNKFNPYQLAKWNKDSKVRLRDAIQMVHPKPETQDQADLYKKILDGTLMSPPTWEQQLSSGLAKKDVFEGLLKAKELGGLATLRNLRNMIDAKVDKKLIKDRLEKGEGFDKILPFSFITAYRILLGSEPTLIPSLESAMFKSLRNIEKLPGKTALIIDLSGSMGSRLSGKSELTCYDAAAALSMLAKQICDEAVIFGTAGTYNTHKTEKLKDISGFALTEHIVSRTHALGGGGIFLVQCLEWIKNNHPDQYARVIVFTDEQDCDRKCNPATAPQLGISNYIVNISSNKNGIAYTNGWNHINGFSERIFDYITESEK
jgi:hypothetical protein